MEPYDGSGIRSFRPPNAGGGYPPPLGERPKSGGFSFFLIVLLGLIVLVSFGIAQGTNGAALAALFVFVGGLLVLYFAPSIVAVSRKRQNQVSIVVLNLLAGWTLVGWVGALVWAYSSPGQPKLALEPATVATKSAQPINASELKNCPYCAEPIRREAIKCKHCGSDLPTPVETEVEISAPALATRPVNELMARYGITFDGYKYVFGKYKYSNLSDAVSYAQTRPDDI